MTKISKNIKRLRNTQNISQEALAEKLKENGYKVTFFAICEYENEAENIKKYYSQFTEKVIALKSLYLFRLGHCQKQPRLLVQNKAVLQDVS